MNTEQERERRRKQSKLYRLRHREKAYAMVKDWARRNPEKIAAYHKKNYLKNHEQNKAKGRAYGKKWYAEKYHLHTYGISREDFDRMVVDQAGLCKICGRELNRPNVDHNHFTGKIRGILCNACNGGLGSFQDSPEILRQAADYLENNK